MKIGESCDAVQLTQPSQILNIFSEGQRQLLGSQVFKSAVHVSADQRHHHPDGCCSAKEKARASADVSNLIANFGLAAIKMPRGRDASHNNHRNANNAAPKSR
ncbi:MAG: hypothetical protein E6848_24640 [Bradyrhizobium sp.]|nr:hypothetical protein [Bradyrhizobium sp.]